MILKKSGEHIKKEKRQQRKIEELRDAYENIISLFAETNEGLTTREVYNGMVEHYHFKRDIKTIENYLKDLKRGLLPGVKLTWISRGKHQLEDFRHLSVKEVEKHIEKLHSNEVVYGEEKAYMRLAMESIRELDTLSSKHHKEIEKRLGLNGMKESPYFIDNEDMESVNMSDADILHLKDAIIKDAIVEFRYTGESRKKWYVVEPYKLIIFDGLWYLFGKDTADAQTPYKTWRLIYIKDVNYEEDGSMTHNMKDEAAEEILKDAEDARFIVDISNNEPVVRKNISIVLKISSRIAESFDHEAHIPGNVSEPVQNNDGSLTICTKVNTLDDVDAKIKAWLPHIEVMEPENYRKTFLLELSEYIEGLKEEIAKLK